MSELRELVERWKREADDHDEDGDHQAAARARSDAAELEALLAQRGEAVAREFDVRLEDGAVTGFYETAPGSAVPVWALRLREVPTPSPDATEPGEWEEAARYWLAQKYDPLDTNDPRMVEWNRNCDIAATALRTGVTEWVPVNERLPEPGVPVLLFGTDSLDEPVIVTGLIAFRGEPCPWAPVSVSGYEWEWAFADRNPTHWMPLPAPPAAIRGE